MDDWIYVWGEGESRCLNGKEGYVSVIWGGRRSTTCICMGRWCVRTGMRCKKRRQMCGRKCVEESVEGELSRERFK